MSLELTARTEPGRRVVDLAEALAVEIGPRAGAHGARIVLPVLKTDTESVGL